MEKFNKDGLYEEARKKVEKIKGFYFHLVIYIVVNILIVYANYIISDDHHTIFEIENFITAILWGIGLFIHGLNVFAVHWFFGKAWEERKINEIMKKEIGNENFRQKYDDDNNH